MDRGRRPRRRPTAKGSRITQKCRPSAAQVKGAATYENQLDSPNQEPALVGADGLRRRPAHPRVLRPRVGGHDDMGVDR